MSLYVNPNGSTAGGAIGAEPAKPMQEVIVRTATGTSLPVSSTLSALAVLWTDGTLVATNGSVQSAFIDTTKLQELQIVRTSTGGTYVFEIDWSRDGVIVDVVDAVTVSNNDSSDIKIRAPWARLRVRNPDAVGAFTAHRTTVSGR